MSGRTCLMLAAVFGFSGVLLGAFGAHGLGDSGYLERKYEDVPSKSVAGYKVPAAYKYLQDFRTGVRYQMWHALALFGVGLVTLHTGRRKALSIAAWAFTAGIVLFSGALYILVIGGPRFGGVPWGLVAPVGGTLLLVGWLSLVLGLAHAPDDPVVSDSLRK